MKIIKFFFIFLFTFNSIALSNEQSFERWLINFKILALKNDVSEKTFDIVMSNAIFLPKVIKYDRFQPEFYEDTKTYISKRVSKQKIKQGLNLYKENIDFINYNNLLILFACEFKRFII